MPTPEDIQNETLQLIAYAKIDREIKRLLFLLEDIPPELKRNIDVLQEKATRIHTLESNLATWQATKSKLEDDEQASKERLQGLKSKLQGIQNMKEYQAALKEIDDAGKKSKERETTLLALMTSVEEAQKELDGLRSEHAGLETQTSEARLTWENERKVIHDDIGVKRKGLEDCARGMSDSLLKKYAHIAKLREPVLAIVQAGVCQECSMQLPPQQYIELQRQRSFQVCPSCQRLVYIP